MSCDPKQHCLPGQFFFQFNSFIETVDSVLMIPNLLQKSAYMCFRSFQIQLDFCPSSSLSFQLVTFEETTSNSIKTVELLCFSDSVEVCAALLHSLLQLLLAESSVGRINPRSNKQFECPTAVSQFRFRDYVWDLCTPLPGTELPRSRMSTVFLDRVDVGRWVQWSIFRLDALQKFVVFRVFFF